MPDGGIDTSNPLLGAVPAGFVPPILNGPGGPPVAAVLPVAAGSSSPDAQPGGGATSGVQSFFGDILKKIEYASGAVSAAYGAGQAVAGQAAAASQQQSQQIINAAQAKAAVDSGDATQKAKQAADEAAIAAKAGLTGPAFDKTLATIQKTEGDLNQFIDQKNKANDVGFFQDPVTYLFNQVVKVPLLQDKIAERSKDLSALTNLTSSQASAMQAGSLATAAVDSVNTTQRAANLSKMDIAQGIADAQKPLMDAAQIQISALGVLNSQADTIIRGAETAAGLPLKEAQVEYYGAAKTSQMMENEAKTGLLEERMNELKQKQTDDTAKLGAINAGLTQFGIPGVKDISVIPTKTQNLLLDMGTRLQAGGGAGEGPLEAVNNIKQLKIVDPNKLPAGQPAMFKDIQTVEAQVRSKLQTITPGQPQLKGAELEAAVINGVAKHYEDEFKIIKDDGSSLISPEPLSSLISRPWAKKNNVIAAMEPKTLDGTGKTIPNVPTRFQDVFSTAATLVANGKSNVESATKDIIDAARNSLADKDMAYGFRRFAIPIDTSKYQVSLPRPGAIFGGNDPVDLFNPAQVRSYLSKIIRSAPLSDATPFTIDQTNLVK